MIIDIKGMKFVIGLMALFHLKGYSRKYLDMTKTLERDISKPSYIQPYCIYNHLHVSEP